MSNFKANSINHDRDLNTRVRKEQYSEMVGKLELESRKKHGENVLLMYGKQIITLGLKTI